MFIRIPFHKLVVFTVEDDQLFSLMMNKVLEDYFNCRIYAFNSAESCMENIGLKPSIVFLDFWLPGMNGQEAFKRIKKILPETYVVVLSSEVNGEQVAELVNEGVYACIRKDKSGFDEIVSVTEKIKKEVDKKYNDSIIF